MYVVTWGRDSCMKSGILHLSVLPRNYRYSELRPDYSFYVFMLATERQKEHDLMFPLLHFMRTVHIPFPFDTQCLCIKNTQELFKHEGREGRGVADEMMKRNPWWMKQQWRGIVKVRLKWVKNRSLDHIIEKETDLKAAWLLKDAIKRSSSGFVTANTVGDWQKLLGLTVPVVRFLRRYTTLFQEFPHPRWPSLSCFRLTDTALLLDSQEQAIHESHQNDAVQRVSKLLMMGKSRALPLHSLHSLKWDLGLPDTFHRTLLPHYPEDFRFVKSPNGVVSLQLSRWPHELAISALQTHHHSSSLYRDLQPSLTFPMRFPRGYGSQNKVKAWMDSFHKLPYVSPYADSSNIDPNSDLMEKRVVGVLHEILSLTLHKKTKRNYLRSLRDEFNLPHKFTRIFTRYPGIFYLSLKCKTTTVTLRDAYQSAKLLDPHPLALHRDKFYHVMQTGLLYRHDGSFKSHDIPLSTQHSHHESYHHLCQGETTQ
ncbi:hypothetical protein VNO78_17983 [Psophocarpus tetragonolobus]|uniref:PORR domain-containing protein n=1 Tax=Psophocarpus tetragonolobus TaxID=3891 RepID=A0AAN9XLK8_PSOTE